MLVAQNSCGVTAGLARSLQRKLHTGCGPSRAGGQLSKSRAPWGHTPWTQGHPFGLWVKGRTGWGAGNRTALGA